MAKYLLVESRDPFDSNDVAHNIGLATGLAKEGNAVTLFLVHNGVLPARRCSASEALTRASRAGVEVIADEFSLRERGIESDRLAQGVEAGPLEIVVDQLADGRKALWH